MVNEALQWAVLLCLSVFVFGLTRQLGHFLISNRNERSAAHGPTEGRMVPRSVIHDAERRELKRLMSERGTPWAAVAAVAEHCVGCRTLIDELEEKGVPERAPLVLLTSEARADYLERVSGLADIVVNGDGRFQAGGIGMTPFVFLLDADLRVVHKAGAATVGGTFKEWRGARNGTGGVLDVRLSEPEAVAAGSADAGARS
jgi:hypothetical protein